MIGLYADNHRTKEAFALFEELQSRNLKPDEITLCNILSACSPETGDSSSIAALAKRFDIEESAMVHCRALGRSDNSRRERSIYRPTPTRPRGWLCSAHAECTEI